MYDSHAVEADTGDKTLSITQRTVSVGAHVYATENICHFGPGKAPLFIIPRAVTHLLVILAIWFQLVASMAQSSLSYGTSSSGGGQKVFAAFMVLLAIVAVLWNPLGPKRYGLLMSLNSGEKRFFATQDKRGLAAAVEQVQGLMESVEQGAAQITVSETKVMVSHSTVGVISTGKVGSISNRQNP